MDLQKIARIEELIKVKRETDAELDALLGGEVVKAKRKWTRRQNGETKEPTAQE